MDTSKFATREDIKGVKKDISAVKADIKDLKTDNKSIRSEILRVEEKVENLQEDVKDIKVILGKMSNTLDGFVGRVDDLTVDNEVGTHQTREHQIKIEDHEKRLKQIESSKVSA